MSKKLLFLLFSICSVLVNAQDFDLKGRVVDKTNEPLAGVSISIKGTTRGSITDANGNYSILVSLNQVLVFSFIGASPQEFIYVGQSKLDVTLMLNENPLNEVVVIGYQTIRKADLTGSVSVFNPAEMKNTIVNGTVGDALGTLPGLSVRTSGAPGGEGKVEIRGTGTFGNSTPLYVVDGIVSNANRDFNFNDIQSIQVLKDASAAAIYGSRAGNGVIIITTKKGEEGKMRIELSARMNFQWLPEYNLTNREQWIKLNDIAFVNAGKIPTNHFDGNTDWQKEVFKTGIVEDYNISFAGGSKESRYFLSVNYQHNSGTTIGTLSERFSLRSNISTSRDFGNNLRFNIGENVAISHFALDELNSNPIVDVYRMLPTIPIYDSNNAAKGGYGYGEGSRDVSFGTNTFAREDFESTTNSNLRIRGNLFTELEAFKSLKYRFNLGFDLSSDKYKYLRKEGYWSYNQPYDPSALKKNQAQFQELVFDNTLEYNNKLGKHAISTILGLSYQSFIYENIWGMKNDVLMFGKNYFDNLDAALNNPKTGNYKDLGKLFSLFSRVNYNFDERYLFSFTLRRDESSKFSPKNRVGYFPSLSVGWRINNEAFFNASWVDDLKLRANYGILGTSNIGVWDWVPFICVFPQSIFGVDQTIHTGMTQIKLANSDLKWEKLNQFNFGFDFILLNNKLSLSVDYFLKETKDVLTPMQILMVTGNNGGNPYVNAATLHNQGLEISAIWKNKISEDFSYSININGTYLKNKIKALGYDRTEFTQWDTKSIVGKSIGEWYLLKTDGLFRSEEEVLAHKNSEGKLIQPEAKPGDIRYLDYNDDGMITDADRQHCGSTIPKFQLGMNLGLEYKGFDLQFQFSGAFGNKSFNGPRSAYDKFDDNSNYRADYDPWSPENPNAKDPRPIYADFRNGRGDQDRWLENGSYLRVKQMVVGYKLPKALLGETFALVRLYVNAQNLITFTAYSGLDPEFLNSNIWDRSFDGGAFPNPRGILFGAQISF